jgi:Cys-tRNA(Pro) deacylase
VTDIEKYIATKGIEGKVLHLSTLTPTVETAAEAIGTTVDKIVKSLVFLIDGQPTLVISPGTRHVDRKRLAKHFGIGRKRVKLANAETVQDLTGFEVGAVPPFGHKTELSVILDKEILGQPIVYAGGGTTTALLEITPTEILRVTGATVLDFQQAPGVSEN